MVGLKNNICVKPLGKFNNLDVNKKKKPWCGRTGNFAVLPRMHMPILTNCGDEERELDIERRIW